MTARETALGSGKERTSITKRKEFRFTSSVELESYLLALIDSQDGLCALTGLLLQYDADSDDPEMLCSLDRINSDGHYEADNLQVVCRFANRWKSDGDDADFRRLVAVLRTSGDS